MPVHFQWPKSPYKGLSYYGPDDVPLFAGRDDAVRRCAHQLGANHARILILHGPTGCGKSSFLRAGLIPFLENQRGRFEFARTPGATQSEAMFIRSTDSPLKALSAELYRLASDARIQTEDGFETLDLSRALLGCKNAVEFVQKSGSSGELLITSLRAVAREWPRSLVLVIDQGEEVLTLKSERDASGEMARKQFFDFVYRFNKTEFDLKLVIALRTEYYGKFTAQLSRNIRDLSGMEVFYLNDLTEPEIVEAIRRPTSGENIPPYGRPSEHYHFSFEAGLPERIAQDVLRSQNIRGGILPVVQIVCENLYNSARKNAIDRGSISIRTADYITLPKVEIQLDEYLRQKLREFGVTRNILGMAMDTEVDRWKDVLSGLSIAQIDGTVVSQLKSKDELRALAQKRNCRLPFDPTMDFLSDPTVRILRGEEVINSVTNEPIWAYSLGHDAIGLVMENWKAIQHERNRLDQVQQVDPPTSRYRSENLGVLYQQIVTVILRVQTDSGQLQDSATFRQRIISALRQTNARAADVGYLQEDIRDAEFALVAFLDETIFSSNSPERAQWTPLAIDFYGESSADSIFFQKLDLISGRRDSPHLADLLEVYLICLLLGYKGRFWHSLSGKVEINAIATRLRKRIDVIRGADYRLGHSLDVVNSVSNATVLPVTQSGLWRRVLGPVAVAAVLFLLYRFDLTTQTATLESVSTYFK